MPSATTSQRSAAAPRRRPEPRPDAASGPGSRPRPRSRRRTRRQRTLRAFGAAFALLALIAGTVVVYGVVQFNRIDRVAVDLDAVNVSEPQNFLIVGSDTRERLGKGGSDDGTIFGSGTEKAPGGKRADTLVIARLDPVDATIELLSIPRDLWVPIGKGTSKQRINAAYNRGAQTLVDTIQNSLGIPIHHYAEVNFSGFKGLVDALDGVPLYFDRPVYDRNSGLSVKKQGCHTLNGVQALAFARSRHLQYSTGTRWVSDGTGDLGRITRQQIFIRHALKKVASLGLDDVGTLRVLTGVAVNNVSIDESLSSKDLLDLAKKFGSFDPAGMVTHRLETTPMRTSGGAAVVTVDTEGSAAALDIFRGRSGGTKAGARKAVTLLPSMVTVDVMNTTGTKGLARDAADRLGLGGFPIGRVDNTEKVKATVIRYGVGAKSHAAYLASRLTPSPKIIESPELVVGSVEIDLAATLGAVVPAPPGTPVVPKGSGGQTAPSAPAVTTTTLPAITPESAIGTSIGDAPPGIKCG